MNSNGAHIYLGLKHGKRAWVIDECFAADETSGQAFILAINGTALPEGKHEWQYFDETTSRHVNRELVLTAG